MSSHFKWKCNLTVHRVRRGCVFQHMWLTLTSGKQNILRGTKSMRGIGKWFTTPVFSISLSRAIIMLILMHDLQWMVTDYKTGTEISIAAPNTSKTFLHIWLFLFLFCLHKYYAKVENSICFFSIFIQIMHHLQL